MLTDLQRSLLDRRTQLEVLASWASARGLFIIRDRCYLLIAALTEEFERHSPCPAPEEPGAVDQGLAAPGSSEMRRAGPE